MLESTLLNVIESLKIKHKLTAYQERKLTNYMRYWKEDDYIYPGVLKSKLNISIKETYEILEYIKSLGILENVFEVYCKSCSKSKGLYLKSLTDMPEDLSCDFCNHEFNVLEDTIVLYKVKSNG